MKKLLIVVSFLVFWLFGFAIPVYAQGLQTFTIQQLAQYDGKDGHKAYFAYQGKVYDVSDSSLWKLGEHFGVSAGKDLTGMMSGAPHGTEVFSRVPLIGTLVASTPKAKQWFEAPIRIFGMSLVAFTGLLLGVFFVLNFATCFSMPWSKASLPWKGARPGPDPLDVSGAHMHWTQIHKYFAWTTVTIGMIHGILGLMAVLGYHV